LTTGDQVDVYPSWSADGESLVFGNDPGMEAKSSALAIKVLNLKTRQVSILPGSEGLWRPGFSPDGRHISALTADSQAIKVNIVGRPETVVFSLCDSAISIELGTI
jgi:Tol biopolymer transport system component